MSEHGRFGLGRIAVGVTVAGLGLIAGAACSGGHPAASASTSYSTVFTTVNAPTPTPVSTGPLDTAPVTAANSSSCTLLATSAAESAIGMRLARVEALSQATTAVGCRFYALQGTALSQSEHLPGPNQPALEIISSAYANETSAHNAAAALAASGSHQQVVTLTGGVQGDVFQTTFDPTDGSNDWVLVFNKAATLVTVKTAVADSSLDAVDVGNQIIAAIS